MPETAAMLFIVVWRLEVKYDARALQNVQGAKVYSLCLADRAFIGPRLRTDYAVTSLTDRKLNLSHLAVAALACVALVACSRKDSLFSLTPNYSGSSVHAVSDVAGCIADRWHSSVRHFSEVSANGAVRIEAQSIFRGVAIGVRLKTHANDTVVEYFQRRVADPIYRSMVKECTQTLASAEH